MDITLLAILDPQWTITADHGEGVSGNLALGFIFHVAFSMCSGL